MRKRGASAPLFYKAGAGRTVFCKLGKKFRRLFWRGFIFPQFQNGLKKKSALFSFRHQTGGFFE